MLCLTPLIEREWHEVAGVNRAWPRPFQLKRQFDSLPERIYSARFLLARTVSERNSTQPGVDAIAFPRRRKTDMHSQKQLRDR